MITPVILSGGVGSRLWPVSREGRPKQFLPIGGARSMLQQTQLRLAGLETAPAIVVCNEAHRFLVAEQFREIGEKPGAIILEPAGRNTAPRLPSLPSRPSTVTPTHFCWCCQRIIILLPLTLSLPPWSRVWEPPLPGIW